MKAFILGLVFLSGSLAHAESDISFYTADISIIPFMTTVGVSQTTAATFNGGQLEKQIILQAKDDATVFLASEGSTRGAYFQRALNYIRRVNPAQTASDYELAAAILAANP